MVGFLYGCGLARDQHGPWLGKHGELYPADGTVTAQWAARHTPTGWNMAGFEARGHFVRRSRGHHSGIAADDLFRGRAAAVARVFAWLTAAQPQGRPLVVTGQPGAGKSALLARVVLRLESEHTGRGVAVHGRGLTRAEVVTALAPLAGLRDVHHADDLLGAVSGTEGPPLMVAVDALDEAATEADRRGIADMVVSLARLPRLRVVVATRALAIGDRHAPGALLRSLGVGGPGCDNLVDLDMDAYFDPADLRAFAAAVLTQDLPGGVCAVYRDDPPLTGRLAAAVAARAGRNHLVAALAATELGAREATVDPADPRFDAAEIPSTVGEAITKYLDTLPLTQQALTRALLTALAYARGDGVDDHRWVRFAVALGYPVTLLHVGALRLSPGSAYLLHSTAGGRGRTTRLFHQALADELLLQPGDQRGDERALLSTLIPDSAEEWAHTDAYSRSHAADHAEAAGRLDMLLDDAHFLAVADLDRLLPLLPADPSPAVTPVAAVLRQATDAASRPPERRARLLALSAAHLGLPRMQAA